MSKILHLPLKLADDYCIRIYIMKERLEMKEMHPNIYNFLKVICS